MTATTRFCPAGTAVTSCGSWPPSKIAVSPGTSGIDTLIAFPAMRTRDSPWQTGSVGLGTQWYPGQSRPLESGLKGAMRPYRDDRAGLLDALKAEAEDAHPLGQPTILPISDRTEDRGGSPARALRSAPCGEVHRAPHASRQLTNAVADDQVRAAVGHPRARIWTWGCLCSNDRPQPSRDWCRGCAPRPSSALA